MPDETWVLLELVAFAAFSLGFWPAMALAGKAMRLAKEQRFRSATSPTGRSGLECCYRRRASDA